MLLDFIFGKGSVQRIKKIEYRQRVYQSNLTGEISFYYGDEIIPDNAKLLADHWIVEVVTISDYKESGPVLIPPSVA